MATKRKKKKSTTRKRKASTLSGFGEATGELEWKETILPTALASALGVGSAGVGAGLGPYSIPLGLVSIVYGMKKNDKNSKFLYAVGIGLIAGTSIKRAVDEINATQKGTAGLDGFNLKDMIKKSKSYFKAFAGKFVNPFGKENAEGTQTTTTETSATPTNGLNGDNVSYFVNPYSSKQELDLSELDKIQQQIREMKSTEGVGEIEIDSGVRNF